MSLSLRHRVTLAAVVASASLLPAQGLTWIVDQAGGPGTHFTDLPPAVAAAADGDTILVRDGIYLGFSTSKALTVLGSAHVHVGSAAVILPPPVIEVSGLPAGKTFTLASVSVAFGGPGGGVGIQLSNNAGRVHLADVRSQSGGFPPPVGAGCAIQGCNEVTLNRCTLTAIPGLSIRASTVAMTSSVVTGQDACTAFICTGSPAGAGIWIDQSTLWLAGTSVHGGDGWVSVLPAPPQPAVRASATTLWITGDATTQLTAGALAGVATAAVEATGGVVQVDTQVVLTGTQGAAGIGGTAQVVRRRIPVLTARGAPPGGVVTAQVVSPVGDAVYVVASVPRDPTLHPAGVVFVDPGLLLPVLLAVQGASERVATGVVVPAVPGLAGAPIVLQASNISAGSGVTEFTNPVVVVLH